MAQTGAQQGFRVEEGGVADYRKITTEMRVIFGIRNRRLRPENSVRASAIWGGNLFFFVQVLMRTDSGMIS